MAKIQKDPKTSAEAAAFWPQLLHLNLPFQEHEVPGETESILQSCLLD